MTEKFVKIRLQFHNFFSRLIGVCFAIHLIHVSMIVYYILKKHKPRQKNVEVGIDVDDKANGTAMIF